MAKVGKLTVDIGTNIAKIQSDLGKAQNHYKKFTKNVGSMFKTLGVTMAATMIAKTAIKNIMAQEEAELSLAVAMKNVGDYSRENFQAMKDYASGLQKVTRYGDEVTLAMMANLKTYGMNTEELKKATVATMDLATAKRMDLKAASELVGKAFVGETGTLSRYGIIIDKSVEKGDKFNEVLKLINQRFGSAAQADLKTYAGQWAYIKNLWGDILEKVGLGLMKLLEGLQVAFGMAAAGILEIFKKLYEYTGKLYELLSRLPKVGGYFEGLAMECSLTAEKIGEAQDAMFGFVQTNIEAVTSFNHVEEAVESMGTAIREALRPPEIEEEMLSPASDYRVQYEIGVAEIMRNVNAAMVINRLSILEKGRKQEAKIHKLKADAYKASIDNMIMAGKLLLTVAGSQNRALFNMVKGLSIVQAVIYSHLAAVKTLKEPMLPYPANVILAGTIYALGMAQVAAIASQSFSSTGGGGGGGGGIGGGGMGVPVTSPTTAPVFEPYKPFDEKEEGKRGTLTIIIEGDVLAEDYYIDKLADKISQAVEDRDVRLIASSAKTAEQLL